MKPAPFDYIRPATLAEASDLLADGGAATAAIAGGQSLLPMLNLRVAFPDLLVDISRLEELRETRELPDAIRLGALTTHAAIEDGEAPDAGNGLMRRVAGQIAYRAIRHHGTIGGSVALADPAADWPACLAALDAEVRIGGRSGERREPVIDFIQGPYATSLAPGDIVLGFDIPRDDRPLRWGFAKVTRKSGAFASSIAIAVARAETVKVVLGAAASRPLVLDKVGAQIAADGNEEALRAAIAADLAMELPELDAYQRRLHTATIVRAAQELRRQ